MTWKKEIVERYGREYVFRQLAEEASELCQAALKLVRVMNNETPVRWSEAQEHLLEEIADVQTMTEIVTSVMLTWEGLHKIEEYRAKKEKRMREWMLENDQQRCS